MMHASCGKAGKEQQVRHRTFSCAFPTFVGGCSRLVYSPCWFATPFICPFVVGPEHPLQLRLRCRSGDGQQARRFHCMLNVSRSYQSCSGYGRLAFRPVCSQCVPSGTPTPAGTAPHAALLQTCRRRSRRRWAPPVLILQGCKQEPCTRPACTLADVSFTGLQSPFGGKTSGETLSTHCYCLHLSAASFPTFRRSILPSSARATGQEQVKSCEIASGDSSPFEPVSSRNP